MIESLADDQFDRFARGFYRGGEFAILTLKFRCFLRA